MLFPNLPKWMDIFFPKTSPKVQGPNGRAHGVEELLFQGSATAELHEGHAEDVGEEKE